MDNELIFQLHSVHVYTPLSWYPIPSSYYKYFGRLYVGADPGTNHYNITIDTWFEPLPKRIFDKNLI